MSGNKINRAFLMKIETIDGSIVQIDSPLTVEFSVIRNNLAKANTANFTIYNLNSNTRSKIVKDVVNTKLILAMEFYAGYEENVGDILPLCFKGNVLKSYSFRAGSDFKTIIEAFDGLPTSSVKDISLSFPKGTNVETQIKAIAQEITKEGKSIDAATKGKTTIGYEAKFKKIATKAVSILGNPIEQLQQLTDDAFSIDSGNIYVLGQNEVVLGDFKKISYQNGLIGTPKKSEAYVEIDMVFEPRVKPSQLLELESLSGDRFNGFYKVTGITHRGTISGSSGGDLITSLILQHQPNFVTVYDNATQAFRKELDMAMGGLYVG